METYLDFNQKYKNTKESYLYHQLRERGYLYH